MPSTYDAVVVGSGPNGLAAAITLARAGRSVLVVEGSDTIGGGSRSAELTRPGFVHDVCSAIHPMGRGSWFFQELSLERHGLEWISPPLAVAHPLDDGSAAWLEMSTRETARSLGDDGDAYRALMDPLVEVWPRIEREVLGPFPFRPRRPFDLARFGWKAVRSARNLVDSSFGGEKAPALFAGLAAHSVLPLEKFTSAAVGLVLGIAGHIVGWPLPRRGSQSIADALARALTELGGEIQTGHWVRSLNDLPPSTVVLCDTSPRTMMQIAGDQLPSSYVQRLLRFRHGPGICKVDFALSAPVPWTAEACSRAGTVHLGGTFDEIASGEHAAFHGRHDERPFVLIAQQSLFDDSRAPDGQHTLWAYCHVPNGSTRDMSAVIENQIERFAPGFRDLILAKFVRTAAEFDAYNPNYVGGDIAGGVADATQLFTRPVPRWVPYSTPANGLYLCSASTPPGGGVHGLCGYHAAAAALRRELR